MWSRIVSLLRRHMLRMHLRRHRRLNGMLRRRSRLLGQRRLKRNVDVRCRWRHMRRCVRSLRMRGVNRRLRRRTIKLTQGFIDLTEVGNESLTAHRSFGFDTSGFASGFHRSRGFACARDFRGSHHLGATARSVEQGHQAIGVRSLFANVFRLVHQPVERGLKIATPVDASGARSYAGALTWWLTENRHKGGTLTTPV